MAIGQSGAGLGHQGYAILFANISSVACLLSGYPGVALLDAAGQQVIQAVRSPSGFLGGLASGATTPPVLTVPPDGTVSALLESGDMPEGTVTICPDYPGIVVTVPDDTASVTLAFSSATPGTSAIVGYLAGCSTPEIHPIVPGSTGRAPTA